jgi:glycosyltransferase involved in cell wall biosynthesis
MRFSLILATFGRTGELSRFLSSLNGQDFRDFELIVVDQNLDDRLVSILEPFRKDFPILHLRAKTGLSRARNVGIRCSSGDIIAFPDDDCWYLAGLLDRVDRFFGENPDVDGLTGSAIDEKGKLVSGRWDRHPGSVNKRNAWYQGTSISMFFSRSMIDGVKGFDETLGLGADTPWKSSEDRDILIRAVENGYRIYYDPVLAVGHPGEEKGNSTIQRAYSYSLGVGHILKTHRYALWFVLYMLLRPTGGILLGMLRFDRGKILYHCSVLWGRLYGRLL